MTTINPAEINPLELPSILLKDRCKLPRISAVYFLLSEDKIQYIGQTVNLKNRWAGHHHMYSQFQLDLNAKIAWLEISSRDFLLEAEDSLIKWFNPLFNRGSQNDGLVSLTQFRKSLTSLCHAMLAGKKELIVTFHQQPVFKVVKLKNDEIEPSIPERSFVQIVRNQSEFLDAIEQYDSVILTARNKRLVRCEKI
jgi:hypothetical protein